MSQMSGNDVDQAIMNGEKNGYNDDYDDEEAEISNYLNQLNDDDAMDDCFDGAEPGEINGHHGARAGHANNGGHGNGGNQQKQHSQSNEKALESAKDMYTIQKKVGTNLKFDYDYYCKFCPSFFSSTKEILNHLKYDHGKNFTIHECQYCMYATRYRANIHRHIQKDHKDIVGNASIPLIRKEAIITDKKLAPKPSIPISNGSEENYKAISQNINSNSNHSMNGHSNHSIVNGTTNSNTNLSISNVTNTNNNNNNNVNLNGHSNNVNGTNGHGMNNVNGYTNGSKSDDSNPNSIMSNEDKHPKYSLRAPKRDASQSESMSDYEEKAKKERRLLPSANGNVTGNGNNNGQNGQYQTTKSSSESWLANKVNGLKPDANKILGNNSHAINGHSSANLHQRSLRSAHNMQSQSMFNGNNNGSNMSLNQSQFMGLDDDDLMMNPIENDFYDMKSNVDRLDKKLINLDTYVANMDTRITTLDTRMVRIEEKLEKILKYIEKQQPTLNK